jgi:hypothetical protein
MTRRLLSIVLTAALGIASSGCSAPLETTYGRVRSASINGTGVLAELFREQGHTVRTAVRLSDELKQWADVIVRFAPYSGPPREDEADWYSSWLDEGSERRLIYVPRDFEAGAEYWSEVLQHLPKNASQSQRERAEKLKKEAERPDPSPPWLKPPPVARPDEWFAVESPKPAPGPVVCKTLDGPWASGVDPARASITREETLKVESETVLLKGDGKPLAIEWTRPNGSRVLVVANGSFLLNEPLTNPARQPLARRVVLWPGIDPRKLAFVESQFVLGAAEQPPWPYPSYWVLGQLLALGLAVCLARAAWLGRPPAEPSMGEDRPAAHPEALGALLARSGRAGEARALLETYRRWRAAPGHRAP